MLMSRDQLEAVAEGRAAPTPEQARWLAGCVLNLLTLQDTVARLPDVLGEARRTGRDPKEIWRERYGPKDAPQTS